MHLARNPPPVVLTNAGIEQAVFDEVPYYVAKRVAKDILLKNQVPATIVKSTQLHEFATDPAALICNDREVVVQDWMIQPIDGRGMDELAAAP
jgi:hypothetical protein